MPDHIMFFRGLRFVCVAAVLGAFAVAAPAQFGNHLPPTQVHDASALKPPAGARVAIVEFADMECPTCGNENPILRQAAQKYQIPWLRHDFPLRQHIWSFQSAVNARWFDTRSKKLGNDYRDAIFANQSSIYNLNVLRDFTQKFARSHGIVLPAAVDPQGKLSATVKADYDLGIRTGVQRTPTVWIVTDHGKGAPYAEVDYGMGNLNQLIEKALADTKRK